MPPRKITKPVPKNLNKTQLKSLIQKEITLTNPNIEKLRNLWERYSLLEKNPPSKLYESVKNLLFPESDDEESEEEDEESEEEDEESEEEDEESEEEDESKEEDESEEEEDEIVEDKKEPSVRQVIIHDNTPWAISKEVSAVRESQNVEKSEESPYSGQLVLNPDAKPFNHEKVIPQIDPTVLQIQIKTMYSDRDFDESITFELSREHENVNIKFQEHSLSCVNAILDGDVINRPTSYENSRTTEFLVKFDHLLPLLDSLIFSRNLTNEVSIEFYLKHNDNFMSWGEMFNPEPEYITHILNRKTYAWYNIISCKWEEWKQQITEL